MSDTFVLTPAAVEDLDEILAYVSARSGPPRARRVLDAVSAGLNALGERPGQVGHRRDDLADESLRVHAVFSFLIVYRPLTRPVQVIRIVHGARDVPRIIEG